MTTQLTEARQSRVTSEMDVVARDECVPVESVLKEIALGHAVIPANPAHTNLHPRIVGRAFRTKVNANIGHSAKNSSCTEECEKLNIAIAAGSDFVMDLSVGSNLATVRKQMIEATDLPLGTVPLYEASSLTGGDIDSLTEDVIINVIRDQAVQGVDFMTLHAGLLRDHVPLATRRLLGIASRGGALLAEWMIRSDKENPIYTRWDDIMDICFAHDVTVSLGDGLRPGCLADASDAAQFAELDVLGTLVHRCRERGVQVMVEGPGHVPFNEIQMNMEKQQRICDNAPFYVLGPVVTDIAPGYDHITSSIGATAAAYYGASLLCYVTPAEHLGLPDKDDVRTGVIAHRIAAHAADVARGLPGARDIDDAMARARMDFDWNRQFELALDGDTARQKHAQCQLPGESESDFCSMCGQDFCAIRTSKRLADDQQS